MWVGIVVAGAGEQGHKKLCVFLSVMYILPQGDRVSSFK